MHFGFYGQPNNQDKTAAKKKEATTQKIKKSKKSHKQLQKLEKK